MKPKLNQRREADKTRSAIIKAATKLFAEKGFSGAPTAAIAKAAKVNEALIFHHFGNKVELWKKVKIEITQNSQVSPISPQPSSLQEFLQAAIQQRLNLYDNNPLLHKIIQWQRLEDKRDVLLSANPLAPNTWIPSVQYLQKQKKIQSSLPAESIVIWLLASINAAVQDDLRVFHDPKMREEYISLIMKGFEKALK
jgi:AcrR family transcriptional regulator